MILFERGKYWTLFFNDSESPNFKPFGHAIHELGRFYKWNTSHGEYQTHCKTEKRYVTSETYYIKTRVP
jgi:hypothetical protein